LKAAKYNNKTLATPVFSEEELKEGEEEKPKKGLGLIIF
jgi:hypothetical protein